MRNQARKGYRPKLARRRFLTQSCGTLAGLLGLPLLRPLPTQGAVTAAPELQIHPHYRRVTPLDSVLQKVDPALDDFANEVFCAQIATKLAELSTSLLVSPPARRTLEALLASEFAGASLTPTARHRLRSGSAVTVDRLTFLSPASLSAGAFVESWQASLHEFSEIHTADFFVTDLRVLSPSSVHTTVRYELVGSGPGFHREQRVGTWEIAWQSASGPAWRIREWTNGSETRSRSRARVFIDIAAQAFAPSRAYSDQLVYGVDHWRTTLDGACGIDVYGHNGVSVGDIDGDGFDDLYVCQPAGLPNRLFRNRGDGTFEDITEGSGVGLLDNTACAIFADFDNDGRQDLVVVRASGPLLFSNQGGGKFREVPEAFRFAHAPEGTFTGAAAADYDRDGWLDIYFCLYVYYQGASQYRYPAPYYDAENGPPNFLMRNNRDGTFSDATAQTGMNSNNTRFSFCCGWSDCNGDGWPDLYVANDFGSKNLYRNNGDGTFTDVAAAQSVADVGAGMSVCWSDSRNRGADDLYVADMWTAAGQRVSADPNFQKDAPASVRQSYRRHAMGNSLYRNDGKGNFQDATAEAGVAMGRWSWSSDSWDFDHDGFADLYVVNGMLSGPERPDLNSFFWRQVVAHSPASARASYDYEQGWNAINELIRADRTWSGYERNVLYANNADGTFSDVSGAVDLDFLEDGRAFALADFDQDGRQEVVLKNRSGPQLRLLKNVVPNLPLSLTFRLRGTTSNRDAIGAAVTIETSRGKQTRKIQAGSGFLSQHSKAVFFGLGDAQGAVRASIRWPSGLVQQLENLPPGHVIQVEEGNQPSRIVPYRNSITIDARKTSAPSSPPAAAGTWLILPVPVPDRTRLSPYLGKPLLLHFCNTATRPSEPDAFPLVVVNVDERESSDTVAVYNILYRYLFDRHRDLTIPASFLIDEKGDLVKTYRGPLDRTAVTQDMGSIPKSAADRLARALPFPGVATSYALARNQLSYGSIYFERGYLAPAEAFFRLALDDQPSSAEALYGMGSVYLDQGKNALARRSFESALSQKSTYPDTHPNAWNNLGILATREGKMTDAIQGFREALRLRPDHFVALENLGNAYRQSKRWDDARATLERAVAMRPQDPEANYSLGMVFAQTDHSDQALEFLERALTSNPDYPEALNNLGILLLRTRRRDDAVAQFRRCMRVAPAFDQAYLNLARVYNVEGDPEKAKSVLRELLKEHPDHAGALAALEQLR